MARSINRAAAYDARSGTISATLAGNAGLTETTAGLVALTGANAYTGGTTISGPGTLAFAQGSLGTTGAITFTDGTLQWLPGNTQDVSGRFAPVASGDVAGFDTGTNSSVTLASPISGAGAFDKYAGTGTLILTAANTMASSEVDQGTLQMGNAGAIGNGQEVYVESPGILDLNGYSPTVGGLWGNGTITTSAGTSALTVTTDPYCGNSEFDGVIQNGAGTVSLTKIGTCTFTMTGQNTYTGGTTINAGTLDLSGGNNRLSTSGGITVAGGTLDLGGYSQTTSGVVSFQGGTVQDGTINKSGAAYDARSGTISVTLAGNAGLTETTAGLVTLSGTNTYTGSTVVTAGELRSTAPLRPALRSLSTAEHCRASEARPMSPLTAALSRPATTPLARSAPAT